MKVKIEPVDRRYSEEGQPPDGALSDPLTVKPETLETFEIPVVQNFAHSTLPAWDCSQKTLPVSFDDIKVEEIFGCDAKSFKSEVKCESEEDCLQAQRTPTQGTSFLIKYEFQNHMRQPSTKEEVTLEDSENGNQSSHFASAFNNQIPDNQELELLHSNNTSPLMFDDIEIEKINVKREVSGHQSIEVVINLEKTVFFERTFVCSICMEVFASIDSLSLHRNDHQKNSLSEGNMTKSDDFYCNQLIYKSSTRANFKTQLSHTGKKPFECDLCVYKSAHYSHLKIHQLSHTGEKPFKCDLCDYKSARKSYLKTHQLTHTGEKPFGCDLCIFKSARKSDLKTHQLSHTGKKPYECDLCDYKSTRMFALKSHKVSHTGKKLFTYDQCDNKYSRKSYLNRHKISHTSQKPFECDLCVYKTAHKSQLKIHKLSLLAKNHLSVIFVVINLHISFKSKLINYRILPKNHTSVTYADINLHKSLI